MANIRGYLATIVKPVSQFMDDWMHVMLASGVFNKHIILMMEQFIEDKVPFKFSMLYEYVGLWTWPKRLASRPIRDLLSDKHSASSLKAGHLKGHCSSMLSVYPVIAYFIERTLVQAGVAKEHCECFFLLADIMDMLHMTSRECISADHLHETITKYITKFNKLYGVDEKIPKFHALQHLPKSLKKFGFLLSCFVHERKHRMLKRYCNDVQNTAAFEQSVMGEITAHQIHMLNSIETFRFEAGLINPKPAPPPLARFLMTELSLAPGSDIKSACESRFSRYETCRKGDVVLVRDNAVAHKFGAGQVWFHASICGRAISLISMWAQLSVSVTACTWQFSENPVLCSTLDILECVVWSRSGDIVTTLLPITCRPDM